MEGEVFELEGREGEERREGERGRVGKDRIRKTEGVRGDACMSEDLINGRIKKECFTSDC